MNDLDRGELDGALLDRVLGAAIVSGYNVLYELLHRECSAPGVWDYLRGYLARESQVPPADARPNAALRRYLLLVDKNGGCGPRAPFMRRWPIRGGALVAD